MNVLLLNPPTRTTISLLSPSSLFPSLFFPQREDLPSFSIHSEIRRQKKRKRKRKRKRKGEERVCRRDLQQIEGEN